MRILYRPTRSACEEYRPWIEEQVRLGRNAVSIYQDLVERFAFEHKYNSVKRFCRALRRKNPIQYDRMEFGPGEEAQVDYGLGAPTRLPGTNTYRRLARPAAYQSDGAHLRLRD